MASVKACNEDWHVRVVSRRLVKASDTSIKPHIVPVSNLDRIARVVQISMFCIYTKPPAGDCFDAVIATFDAGLPSFLNHFFPLTGRIANTSSGIPELHCSNQGAELVVGEAAGVALASLDYHAAMGSALQKIQVPYGEDMALSVQVVSFACGGFTVAWRTNHVVADGCALSSLVTAWSVFARSGTTGTLPAGLRPNHDRSAVCRPRAPPSYGASLDEAFTPLDARHQVNALTANQSSVLRFYYIEASDVAQLRDAASRGGGDRATRVEAVSAYLWKALAGVVAAAGESSCRMGWWVNGRRRLTSPELRRATRNYFGNVIAYSGGEAGVQEVMRMPLPDVAAKVREAITAPAYEEHFQELVDWVEEHTMERHILSASIGLGSPTLILTAFTSFPIDTDFGFGHAVMAVPTTVRTARLCSAYVQLVESPGGDGSWIVSAFVWPQLAVALESDEPQLFRPLTADQLGLVAPQEHRSRL